MFLGGKKKIPPRAILRRSFWMRKGDIYIYSYIYIYTQDMHQHFISTVTLASPMPKLERSIVFLFVGVFKNCCRVFLDIRENLMLW